MSEKRLYVDSSVLLGLLLRDAKSAVLDLNQFELITSELTELECRRTLDRIRLHEQSSDEAVADRISELTTLLTSVRMIQLSPIVFQRAKAPYPTVIRSLDALHLATAELARCKFIATHDKQQAIAAKAIGLSVLN